MEKRTIDIRGMSCEHCVMSVRRELERIPGITVHEVRIGSAIVSYDPASTPIERIEAAVAGAGFAVRR